MHPIELSGDKLPRRKPWLCWMRKTGVIFIVVAVVVTTLVLLWRW